MTTIRDVAKAAGASTATVSHVLNGSRFVSAETKTRVEEAIRALHYRPHGVARSLRRSRTHTIGVMISDIANPFFADLVLGVEDVVHRDVGGYNFILCNTEESRDKERMYFDVLAQKRIDGLIIAPAGGNDDAVKDMIAHGLPVVCVDREFVGVEADTIVVDNRSAAKTIVRHLIALGHRRIAVLRARLRRQFDRRSRERISRGARGVRPPRAKPAISRKAPLMSTTACRIAIEVLRFRSTSGRHLLHQQFHDARARCARSRKWNCAALPTSPSPASTTCLGRRAFARASQSSLSPAAQWGARPRGSCSTVSPSGGRTHPYGWVLPTELHVREFCGANNRR